MRCFAVCLAVCLAHLRPRFLSRDVLTNRQPGGLPACSSSSPFFFTCFLFFSFCLHKQGPAENLFPFPERNFLSGKLFLVRADPSGKLAEFGSIVWLVKRERESATCLSHATGRSVNPLRSTSLFWPPNVFAPRNRRSGSTGN